MITLRLRPLPLIAQIDGFGEDSLTVLPIEPMRLNMTHHIVRPKDLVEKTGLSRSTLRRMELAGILPPRVKLGEYCVGWHSTDVDAWLKSLPNAVQTEGQS